MLATILETGEVVKVKKDCGSFIVFHLNEPERVACVWVTVGIISKNKVEVQGTIKDQLQLF